MTTVIKSKYKVCRRLNVSIWGNAKDAFNSRSERPGQHGPKGRSKKSDYGIHLDAKQTIKAHYGRVREKQFKNLFARAAKMKGNTAENFAGLLERRLDIIVYRLNLAPSIFAARQLVSHKHFKVNGKIANIASMLLKDGDEITVADSSKETIIITETAKKQERAVPSYLSFDASSLTGKKIRSANISDIPYPFQADFNKVVEFYNQ